MSRRRHFSHFPLEFLRIASARDVVSAHPKPDKNNIKKNIFIYNAVRNDNNNLKMPLGDITHTATRSDMLISFCAHFDLDTAHNMNESRQKKKKTRIL